MPDSKVGPKLAVDNEDLPRKFLEKARKKLDADKPNHTFEDVLAEAERLQDEEKSRGE